MSSGTENCLTARPEMTSPGETGLAGALFRLTKPGIVFAEVLAGLAGMLLASPRQPVAVAIFPVLVAIALAAGGAAMLNGLLDAEPDRRMPRLAARCQALAIAGPGRVLVLSLMLMGGGLILAALTAPPPALLLLAGGCLSYLCLYTFWLKRRSPWAVLAGGIPGALPPLIGATAVSGTLAAPPLLLAATIFIWQLPHFWLLALDCRQQYARAGIPVLPVTHGESLTKAFTLAGALLLLPVTLVLSSLLAHSVASFAVVGGAGLVFSLFCAHCLYRTNAYRKGFIASLVYLLVIIAVILCESFLSAASCNRW